MLDVGTAIEIEDQLERNRATMRQQVSAQIENGQLKWSPRDAMAFIEQDARLGEQRSAALFKVFEANAQVLGRREKRRATRSCGRPSSTSSTSRVGQGRRADQPDAPRRGLVGDEDDLEA